MILPAGASLGRAVKEERKTSRTYRLDLENNRIIGSVDEVDAVRQFIFKALSTQRYAYFIYTNKFGLEQRAEGGYSTELERWVSEALLVDDRITAIEDFQTETSGDEAVMRFTVVSIYGRLEERRTLTDV